MSSFPNALSADEHIAQFTDGVETYRETENPDKLYEALNRYYAAALGLRYPGEPQTLQSVSGVYAADVWKNTELYRPKLDYRTRFIHFRKANEIALLSMAGTGAFVGVGSLYIDEGLDSIIVPRFPDMRNVSRINQPLTDYTAETFRDHPAYDYAMLSNSILHVIQLKNAEGKSSAVRGRTLGMPEPFRTPYEYLSGVRDGIIRLRTSTDPRLLLAALSEINEILFGASVAVENGLRRQNFGSVDERTTMPSPKSSSFKPYVYFTNKQEYVALSPFGNGGYLGVALGQGNPRRDKLFIPWRIDSTEPNRRMLEMFGHMFRTMHGYGNDGIHRVAVAVPQ